jgi:formamidopyrimidine-DNA glycosylase
MSGRLFVQPDAGGEPLRKHEHWRWQLHGDKGSQLLRYVDARRFGALDVLDVHGRHPLLDRLGPEPMDAAWTARDLLRNCRGRSVPVKQVLMDAAVVVGIGNIYASETCFRAAVHPLRPAGKVKQREAQSLVDAARAVLAEAIAAGGSSLRDFVGGDEAPGYFQQRLDVYDRAGQACHRCGGLIERAITAQRATYWCRGCQR